MSRFRQVTAAAVVVLSFALQTSAAPSTDGDIYRSLRDRVDAIVKIVKKVLIPTPNDDLQPPHP